MSAVPTISNGVVLTGFSLNSSFGAFFIVGNNFVQANLNQPFRFGNVSDSKIEAISAKLQEPVAALDNARLEEILAEYDLVDYVAGLQPKQRVEYSDGYITNSNTGANQFLFFLPGRYDPQIVTFAEETKHPVTPGELLTQGSAPPFNAFEGPVLVFTGCK